MHLVLLLIVIIFNLITPLHSYNTKPEVFNEVNIVEKLESSVDNLSFIYNKQLVTIDELTKDDIPTIINFVYYSCPKLCHLLTDGLVEVMNKTKLKLGIDYRVLTVSFDHRDNENTREAFQNKYRNLLMNKTNSNDWIFALDNNGSVIQFTEQLGFKFKFLPKEEEYAHGTALIFISPDKKITRYLYGIRFNETDFKYSILESKKNHSVSTIERLTLFCYNYDPDSNSYVLQARNIMKLSGLFTMLVLFIFTAFTIRKETKRKNG